jgi:hypothetical protein
MPSYALIFLWPHHISYIKHLQRTLDLSDLSRTLIPYTGIFNITIHRSQITT